MPTPKQVAATVLGLSLSLALLLAVGAAPCPDHLDALRAGAKIVPFKDPDDQI